jgi:CheY-like chemotaxis protein
MARTIMVVDDEPDIIFSVKCGLEDFADEYIVLGAKNGYECFDLLKKGQIPDLILLDVMMPEMNGWDVFTELKATLEWRDISVVFLTAKTDPYSKGFGTLLANDFIEKPFEINNLKERIDNVLDKVKCPT